MNKDKLILKDGSTIELEAGASLTALQVICQSADDVILLWKRLTQENLQEVTVKNGADLIVGVYSEMVLIKINCSISSAPSPKPSFPKTAGAFFHVI